MVTELENTFSRENLFEQLDRLEGEVFREVSRRRTLRLSIQGKSYFLKIHRGVGWGEIFKNLVQLRLPVLGARNEWLAIQRLTDAGVPTMEAVLYLEEGGNPASRRSAIMTRDLENRVSLEHHEPADAVEKWLLTTRIADMARRMHQAGVNHRDFYLCHFLMHEDEHQDLRLIDLHRAQIRSRVPDRWLVKDLGALLFSAFDRQLTRRDLLRFLRVYRGEDWRTSLRQQRGFWRRVMSRARQLYLQDHPTLPDALRELTEIP